MGAHGVSRAWRRVQAGHGGAEAPSMRDWSIDRSIDLSAPRAAMAESPSDLGCSTDAAVSGEGLPAKSWQLSAGESKT